MQNSNGLTFRRLLKGSAFALASAVALSLSGCLAGEDDDETGGDGFSFSIEGDVVSHAAPAGEEPGTLVVESSEYTCWDDEDEVLPEPAFSTSRDTSHYAIVDGKLYLWGQDDCWAQSYTGTSSTVKGTWTSTSLNSTKIPAAYRSEECAEEYESCEEGGWCEDSYNDDEYFANLKAVAAISDATVRSTVSGQYCMASFFVGAYVEQESLTGFEVVSTGCASVRIRNTTADKIATFSSASNGSTHTLTFDYNGATCTMSTHFGPVGENTQCAEANGGMDTDGFADCMYGSGFYLGMEFESEEDFSLAKGSSEEVQSAIDILKGGISPFTR